MTTTENRADVVEELLGLYREYGASDYIGEPVTQIQHALQASEQAKIAGYDREVVLGAFFHDVGHLIGQRQGLERMITKGVHLGIQNHAKRGQAYLESLGFKGRMSELVGMHVQAKRYLVATIDQYYSRLSDASKLTLEHQGGPMSEQEVADFEKHPLKNAVIQMRRWDEKAKDSEKFLQEDEASQGLAGISQLLYEQLNYEL